MAQNTSPAPASLDDLLAANKDRFDSLFETQMKVAPPPIAPARPVSRDENRDAASGVEPQQGPNETATDAPADSPATGKRDFDANSSNNGVSGAGLRAELNRRFTIFWSTETVDQQIQNDRAVVVCKLTVGEESRTESGSSRVGDDGDEAAATKRAFDRALNKCADALAVDAAPVVKQESPLTDSQRTISQPVDGAMADQLSTALRNIRKEMEAVLLHSGLGAGMRDRHAEIPMIADAKGNMIAGHGGSFIAHMLSSQKLSFESGDVLLQSDPYHSGGAIGHVNDWLILVPVFIGTELIGFTSMTGHVSDAGGSTAGSMPAQARSIFSEGIRIPPIKIVQAGALNEAALELVLNNSRTPESNRADLMSLIAGCRAGASQLRRLCRRFGPSRFQQACSAILERSNQAMRRLITDHIPEEPQSFEDQVDDDGCGNGPFKLKLTVWREDDHAYIDWTGSSPQAPGPINFYLHIGLAKSFVGAYLTGRGKYPAFNDDGFYDLIHVTLPARSILNPEFPAALGRREPLLDRHLDVLSNALGRHQPQALSAAGAGSGASFRFSGVVDGLPFDFSDRVSGGDGARPGKDGRDGLAFGPLAALMSTENAENEFPIVVESYASIKDTGGPGLTRGGNGIEKVYRMLSAGELSIHDDRHLSQPWGVHGGQPGASSVKWIVRANGQREDLPAKFDGLAVAPGDRIVFQTAGGGGCGNPFERDPVAVRRDVAGRLASVDQAANGYGVVLAGPGLEIDHTASQALRDRLRSEQSRGE